MTVLNDLDRFYLVFEVLERLPQLKNNEKCILLKQQLDEKLIEHRQYINKHGQDLPEIRHWQWN